MTNKEAFSHLVSELYRASGYRVRQLRGNPQLIEVQTPPAFLLGDFTVLVAALTELQPGKPHALPPRILEFIDAVIGTGNGRYESCVVVLPNHYQIPETVAVPKDEIVTVSGSLRICTRRLEQIMPPDCTMLSPETRKRFGLK